MRARGRSSMRAGSTDEPFWLPQRRSRRRSSTRAASVAQTLGSTGPGRCETPTIASAKRPSRPDACSGERCEAGLQRGDRDDDEQSFDHDHPDRARCLVDGTSDRRGAEGHGQRLHLRAVTASAPPCVESAIGCPKALRARAINSRVRCGCSASICPLFCGQQGPLVWSAEPSSVCSVESGPEMN